MKNEILRIVVGILAGVAAFILVAQTLNLLFDWFGFAIVIGAFVGVETGLFVGAFSLTMRKHVVVGSWLSYVILNKITPVFTSSTVKMSAKQVHSWANHRQVFVVFLPWIIGLIPMLIFGQIYCYYFWEQWLGVDQAGSNVSYYITMFVQVLYYSLLVWKLFIDGLNEFSKVRYTYPIYDEDDEAYYKRLAGKYRGYFAQYHVGYLAAIAFSGFISAALAPFLLSLIVVLLAIFLVAYMTDCAVMIAGQTFSRNITVGVLVGGLTGLAFGWTELVFLKTLLEIVIGSAAGIASCLLLRALGRQEWWRAVSRILNAGS